MITIITPFYNSEHYIKQSIDSVLNQTFKNWELLLINDGSTDSSKKVVESFKDSRIHYFEQENKGVAAARNLGLAKMKGDYFCFLDSDDMLTPTSLESRLNVFMNTLDLTFVDGWVERRDSNLSTIKGIWKPTFKGKPLNELIKLKGNCFFGPSWMIKRFPNKKYQFNEGLSHGEDLLFFMELAREGGDYFFAKETILHYRNTPGSAMKNLNGLEKGYRFIGYQIKQWDEVSKNVLLQYNLRYRKTMALAYIQEGKFLDAIKVCR